MPMRKYVPNDRDREIVLRMAAIPGVTHDDVAFCITNERTGRAINRRTLEKHCAKELQTGMAVMKEITMKSFVEQVKAHVWPATRLALANYCGLKDNAEAVVNANTNILKEINVRFVPSPYLNEALPAPLEFDVEAKPEPMRLPAADIPIAKTEPAAPRTELDLPWYQRPGYQ